jgi:5'-3' exonuclease
MCLKDDENKISEKSKQNTKQQKTFLQSSVANICTGLALTFSWESTKLTFSLISNTQVLAAFCMQQFTFIQEKKS